MSDSPSPLPIGELDERREWWHEAVTMALYVSLSLLAVIAALPQDAAPAGDLWLTLLLTAVALLLAHQVASRISTRLLHQGLLDRDGRLILAAQLAGGLAIGIAAALPVLLFGPDAVRISEVLLIAFVAGTGYLVGRSAGRSRLRSLAYVALVVAAVIVVLLVKSLVGH